MKLRSLLTSFLLVSISTGLGAMGNQKLWPSHQVLEVLKDKEEPVQVERFENNDRTYFRGVVYVPCSPDDIWKIMSSCREVVEMVPQIRQCEIRDREGEEAVIYHKVKLARFLPSLKYLLDANFTEQRTIDIKLREGDLSEFDGRWAIDERSTHNESWVTIHLYMDPGPLVPQGLVNGKLEKHIPKVMMNLRERVLKSVRI